MTSEQKPLLKLLSFKLIVGLQVLQNVSQEMIPSLLPSPQTSTKQTSTNPVSFFPFFLSQLIFSYLKSSGDLHANNHLTFLDLSVGIPNLLVCGEMVIFAILFQFAYPVGPYLKSRNSLASYQGGFLGIKALLSAINVLDLLVGIVRAPAMMGRGRAKGFRKGEEGVSGDDQQEMYVADGKLTGQNGNMNGGRGGYDNV